MIKITEYEDLNIPSDGFVYLENDNIADNYVYYSFKHSPIADMLNINIYCVTNIDNYSPLDILSLVDRNKLLVTYSSFIDESMEQLEMFLQLFENIEDVLYIDPLGHLFESLSFITKYDKYSKTILKKFLTKNIIISKLDNTYSRLLFDGRDQLVEVKRNDWNVLAYEIGRTINKGDK